MHTVRGTAANVNDVVEAHSLLHGQESDVFADAGYTPDQIRHQRQWQGRAGAWTSDMLGFGEDWRERLREVENQKED